MYAEIGNTKIHATNNAFAARGATRLNPNATHAVKNTHTDANAIPSMLTGETRAAVCNINAVTAASHNAACTDFAVKSQRASPPSSSVVKIKGVANAPSISAIPEMNCGATATFASQNAGTVPAPATLQLVPAASSNESPHKTKALRIESMPTLKPFPAFRANHFPRVIIAIKRSFTK